MARRRQTFSSCSCFSAFFLLDLVYFQERTSFVISNFAQSRWRRFTGSTSGVSLLGSDAEPSDHKTYGKSLVVVASDPGSFQIWQACSSTAAIFLYFVDRDLFSEHLRRLFRHIQCLPPHTSYLHGVFPSHNLQRHSFGLALSSYSLVANGHELFSAYNRRSTSASLDLVSESVSNYLSVCLTEETLVSVSRRSRHASLVTNLGQDFGLKLQRMNLSWAWPINVLTWIFNGHLSFMDVKSTWPIRGSLLACPKLPILQLPQLSTVYVSFGCFLHIRLPSTLLSLLSPLRPVPAGDSAQLPPLYLSSVAPRLVSWNESVSTLQSSLVLPDSLPHQPSSYRGQRETFFPHCSSPRYQNSSCRGQREIVFPILLLEGENFSTIILVFMTLVCACVARSGLELEGRSSETLLSDIFKGSANWCIVTLAKVADVLIVISVLVTVSISKSRSLVLLAFQGLVSLTSSKIVKVRRLHDIYGLSVKIACIYPFIVYACVFRLPFEAVMAMLSSVVTKSSFYGEY